MNFMKNRPAWGFLMNSVLFRHLDGPEPKIYGKIPLKQIKMRIEDLIEREFIKRDENDKNIYHYLS